MPENWNPQLVYKYTPKMAGTEGWSLIFVIEKSMVLMGDNYDDEASL